VKSEASIQTRAKVQTDAKAFAARVEEHLFGHILPFWCGPAVDRQGWGWMGWLSNDLKEDRSQPRGLIVNSRILWAFSAAHRIRPEKQFRQMAERACDVVYNRFWDAQHGGAFWRLNDAGQVIDDSKKIYGQAFYIYALAEYHQAFGAPDALRRAIELFELVEQHAHDGVDGGYWEVRRRDWSEAVGARLSDRDLAEKKSMNNHLHLLEAYTNLCRVWKNDRVKERLVELTELFEKQILDRKTKHLNHFFDEKWNVKSNTYTFGHDIEATWLLCEAAEVLQRNSVHGRSVAESRVKALALEMAEVALREGIDSDGALSYEGKGGHVLDSGKECWPQAEAMVGFLNAFEISREDRFFTAARRVWDFIEERLADKVNGEWFWRIAPNGQPDPTLPKVSEWKGPYHGTRACLESLHRLGMVKD
jgi:mannobiose 2-epimerase